MSRLPRGSQDEGDGGRRRSPAGRWIWIAALGLALALVILTLFYSYPGVLDFHDDGPRFVYLVILALFVGGSAVFYSYRIRAAIRDAAIWIGIVLVVLVGYSFREDLTMIANRLAGELSPSAGEQRGGTVVIRRTSDGHFWVDAAVDGRPIRLLVDTGATEVTLSQADARRLGYPVDRLQYGWPARTANGTVYGARIRIDKLELGPIVVRDVPAVINGGEMHGSLLGLSFLDRLGSYEVRGDSLILRPRSRSSDPG